MISVVMPVYNEELSLPDTLASLESQPGDFEIIAVDGGSSDATKALLSEQASVKLLDSAKGRAVQMNRGAREAKGEWLLFLHADTLLPGGALARLNQWEPDQELQAGGFKHQFSGDGIGLRLISWLDNLRCRHSRIIYGDQAMFVRTDLFHQLGGFPEDVVMEDVAFCERLVEVTEPRLLPDRVITSSRKFEQMGVWRSFLRVALILARHELGLTVNKGRFFADVR